MYCNRLTPSLGFGGGRMPPASPLGSTARYRTYIIQVERLAQGTTVAA